MPPVNILIKPASSACNMSCRYCFYHDVASNRDTYFEGMISLDTMEQVIKNALDYAEGFCSFTFQGGEPTLRGLDFFKDVTKLVKKYNTKNLPVNYNIQTNGTLITADWCEFFKEHNVLVGLSLDGPSEFHNLNRKFHDQKNTWNTVMNTVNLFNKYKVEYNILSVVTGKNAHSINKIYNFYKKNDFKWLQFIPCLEPLGGERGRENYHLSSKDYGVFLINLFDLWYKDLMSGNYVSIRFFDNLVHMLLGRPPEACNMNGRCSIQFVVEGDGSIYPCDFYVLDEWKLGNIKTHTFNEMLTCERANEFVKNSTILPEKCKTCEFLNLCRNGCRRDRNTDSLGNLDINYYCEAFKTFYSSRTDKLIECARFVSRQ